MPTYQTLDETNPATGEESSGQQTLPSNVPLPQGGYHGYNGNQFISGHSDQIRPAYRARLAIKLGILQIVLGTLAIVCGIVILVKRIFLYFTGMGVGAGTIFMSAGIFALVSSRQKATWAIITCMVLSIVSAVAAGVTIIASGEGIDIHYKVKQHSKNPADMDTGIILHSILIVGCFMELVVSVLQATSCCRATCCMPGSMRPEIMVVYLPQPVVQSVQNGTQPHMPELFPRATLMVPPGHSLQQHGQNATVGQPHQNGIIMNGVERVNQGTEA